MKRLINIIQRKGTVLILLTAWMLIFGKEATFCQFIQNSSRSLFSDVKAFQEGDAIMVLILEETQAENEASTTESRTTDISAGLNLGAGTNSFRGDAGINTGNAHKARGQNMRKERIKSRLSAKVIEIVDNGNLKIEGKRTTKINGEIQTITIQGIVRPVDISPDNSIYSYSILDLTLFIEGDGNVSEIQDPGLITKFLRFLF